MLSSMQDVLYLSHGEATYAANQIFFYSRVFNPVIHSTHTPMMTGDLPHAHTLHSEEVLQVLATGHVRAGDDLSLVVGHGAGVRPTAVDERTEHLELGECSAHPVRIQHGETQLGPEDQRRKRVCPSNLSAEEVSDPSCLDEE